MPRKPKPKSEPAGDPGTPTGGTSSTKRASDKSRVASSIGVRVSPVQNKIRPPSHLRKDTQAWWLSVHEAYALDPHHVRLLTLAAEAFDRAVEAREAIAKHGAVYEDRWQQPRARPEVGIERDSRIAFARLVRELGLDAEAADEGDRPPRVVSTATKKGIVSTAWDADDRAALGLD